MLDPGPKRKFALQVFATDEFLVIVMDYASIGPLSQRIATEGPLEEDMTKLLFRQLVDGMVYCHRSILAFDVYTVNAWD